MQDECSNPMRLNYSTRPRYKQAACMSPIRWWDLHPLDSPHVSDFVAELSILSNDHICPCHQATAKAYFCISHAITCHMTLDASLRPSNVKCCNWAHLYHSGTLQSMWTTARTKSTVTWSEPTHKDMAAVCQIIILLAMCIGHSHEKWCQEEF